MRAVQSRGQDQRMSAFTGLQPVQVKICCIASMEEAELALECGANFLGLVSAMPSGPGVIPDDAISRIAEYIAGRAKTVLLTSRVTAAEISRQLVMHRVDIVQLCDAVADTELTKLRDVHPDIGLMQVIHVRNAASVKEAVHAARYVDAILLDSGNPDASIKELGGTGRVHDWNLSRQIRDSIDKPLFLAGGLRAGNVRDGVHAVRPFGVDVCSGVREQGVLVQSKLIHFMGDARRV